MSAPGTTWSGSHAFGATALHRPTSLAALRRVLRDSDRLRPLGTRHSFTDLADSPGDLVSLEAMPEVVEVDGDARRVRVSAGTTYAALSTRLHAAGWALANLASLPHISVGGSVATGTHGSGDRLGSLATQVRAVELVTVEGQRLRVAQGDPGFEGHVVALGALGVVTHLELEVEPTYDVAQWVLRDADWSVVDDDLDQVSTLGESTSIFTDWRGPTFGQVWVKTRTPAAEPSLPGARLAEQTLHMLPTNDAGAVTEQGGRPGPWHERLPHFRPDQVPSAGAELQSEWFVEREHAADAIVGLRALGDLLAPVLQCSEIRTVAGDDLWLSGAHGGDRVAFHFTWHLDWAGVRAVLPAVEDVLVGLGGRAHWAKVWDTSVEPAHLDDFRALAAELDPARVLVNDFLETRLGL